ncbi:hypothetical protein K1T71_003329 [Dendrolimus kikuchii]|uniref:Uncharacterized protein n=1 Tax=Dendrolimus kikuchii TaxID=765133 RepID=A0ACC1DBC6_9NEOP|nr:hypothetical protein K1T71_003329 [Dendrolimus kikuchii]
MGIKGLWAVLTPYSEKKALHEIRGQTVAVDLSGWVCDSQNVTDYHIQPKLYLRNLFFRTVYLLLADVNPVFVLEGDAPELKRDVMAARNAIQFSGTAAKTETTNKKPDVARRRFGGVLKECESLLKCMGVKCIKGTGEAEATCALLNAQGLVDAVVSQDSDCFAYGARRVYRNFSVSSSAGGGAIQGSVDCYDAKVMYDSNGFGRNKMVALAMLCGCDYGLGACGTSINTVVAFLHTVADNEVIPRLLSWVSDPDHYEKQTCWVSIPGRCDRCGHSGRSHLKKGCPSCGTHSGCQDNGHKTKITEVKRELSLRNKALSCGMRFPEPKIMKEFLNSNKENIDLNNLRMPTPSLVRFVKLMSYKLDWSARYCVEKFLPLLTKWHLRDDVPCRTIIPITIKKKRNPRGVPSYEVVWSDIDGQYEALIPDDQFEEDEDPLVAWTSTERQDLMLKFYPELVEAFEESIKKPPKVKKGRQRKENAEPNKPKKKYNRKPKQTKSSDKINDSVKVLNKSEVNSSKNNVSISVNKLKRKMNKVKKGNQKTLESFLSKKRKKSMKNTLESIRRSFNNLSLPNDEANKENVNNLSMFNKISDDSEQSNLSDIVDRIIDKSIRKETVKVDNNVFRLVFDKYSTPRKHSLRKSILLNQFQNHCSTPKSSSCVSNLKYSTDVNNSMHKVNTSYFFDKLTDEGDAFEMSLEHKSAVINLDCDTTVDYSLPHVCV